MKDDPIKPTRALYLCNCEVKDCKKKQRVRLTAFTHRMCVMPKMDRLLMSENGTQDSR